MRLYLLRHGIAEDVRPGLTDEQRQLTPEGAKKLREAMKLARDAGVRPTMILTSPLLRAVQTAEIAASELNYKGDLVYTESLTPDSRLEDVWQEIRTHSEQEELLLSSHNPLCSMLAPFLLGAPELNVDYKKGAMMRIDLGSFGVRPRGVLRWFFSPSVAGA